MDSTDALIVEDVVTTKMSPLTAHRHQTHAANRLVNCVLSMLLAAVAAFVRQLPVLAAHDIAKCAAIYEALSAVLEAAPSIWDGKRNGGKPLVRCACEENVVRHDMQRLGHVAAARHSAAIITEVLALFSPNAIAARAFYWVNKVQAPHRRCQSCQSCCVSRISVCRTMRSTE